MFEHHLRALLAIFASGSHFAITHHEPRITVNIAWRMRSHRSTLIIFATAPAKLTDDRHIFAWLVHSRAINTARRSQTSAPVTA